MGVGPMALPTHRTVITGNTGRQLLWALAIIGATTAAVVDRLGVGGRLDAVERHISRQMVNDSLRQARDSAASEERRVQSRRLCAVVAVLSAQVVDRALEEEANDCVAERRRQGVK